MYCLQMVADEVTKEKTEERAVGDDEHLLHSVVTDDENDEEEYESWKIRELKRMKRDRDEREQYALRTLNHCRSATKTTCCGLQTREGEGGHREDAQHDGRGATQARQGEPKSRHQPARQEGQVQVSAEVLPSRRLLHGNFQRTSLCLLSACSFIIR